MRVLAAGLTATALAGCDAGGAAPRQTPTSAEPAPTPAARAELAARAAAAQDLVAVSFYALRTPGSDQDRTVMVVRAGDGGWRVDVAGGALGGTTDVSIARTGDGLFHCGPAGCVRVDELTAAVDPRVQHVFTDWLDVLTDRSAALSVSAAEPPDGVSGDTRCFGVQPSAASLLAPLDAGVYCYQPDGTLTAAELELGTLTLTGTGEVAPPTVDLPGPVIAGEPLPTASPTPSPNPSPTPSPNPSPSPSRAP